MRLGWVRAYSLMGLGLSGGSWEASKSFEKSRDGCAKAFQHHAKVSGFFV